MIFAHPPAAGDLLVAAVGTQDPHFNESVVLLLDSDEGGALGVVINRLAETDLDDVLPSWQEFVSPPARLFAGGPVSPNGAVCVARVLNSNEEPPGWRPVRDDMGLLHLDTPTEIVSGAYSDLRIFAGYAGGESGQLEGEILRGGWHRMSARPEDVFCADPGTLWRRCLRRIGGDTALFSTWTDKVDLN